MTEQELLILPEYKSSPLVFSGVLDAHSIGFYVVFYRPFRGVTTTVAKKHGPTHIF
jgi:hypothetical protein